MVATAVANSKISALIATSIGPAPDVSLAPGTAVLPNITSMVEDLASRAAEPAQGLLR